MPKNKKDTKDIFVRLEVKIVEQDKDPKRAVMYAIDSGVLQDAVKEHGCEVVQAVVRELDPDTTLEELPPLMEKPSAPRWEFMFVEVAEPAHARADVFTVATTTLGQEGWELVNFCRDRNMVTCCFKRLVR